MKEPGENPIAAPPELRLTKALLVLAATVVLGIGLVLGYFLTPKPPPPASSVMVIRPTLSVITALHDLAKLESADCHVERVIDLKDKQTRLFGLVHADDAILLVASGDVVAGVDLSKLRDGDITIDKEKKSATIRLPAPQILSSRLDNEHTYVHTRTTDILAKRKETLETEARQEAEKSIVEAAKQSGLMGRAKNNAKRTVESLVRSLGYGEVRVEFRDAE
jgi:Protein of unknown function (DUF4230)